MADIAIREMIKALRSETPGIGLKKLTANIKAIVPDGMAPEKKTIKDICRQLDAPGQPTIQVKPRDANFKSRVRAAFEMFRNTERSYLFSLNRDTIRQLAMAENNANPRRWWAASRLRHYFEIGLTIMGKKPCTQIGMNSVDIAPVVLNGVVLQCLSPMMQQFELEAYGFTLRYVAHEVVTDHHTEVNFQGGWVFADMRSEKWYQVENVFLVPHPGVRIPEVSVGAALGYPLQAGCAAVQIVDETETAELQRVSGEENQGGVVGTEFFCTEDKNNFRPLIDYYLQCKKAFEGVGVETSINATQHPMFKSYLEFAKSRNINLEK